MRNIKNVVDSINNKLILKDKINKNKNNNSNAPVGVAYYATHNAITLLALVITIILLLILAGVTISIVIGPNGLLNKAQETAKQHKIQEIQERLELEKGNASLDNKGKLTLEQYLQHLVDKGIVNKEEIENTENEKAKQITVEKYIFLVEEEENGNIKITYQGEAGKLKPILEIEITQITTNTITVKAQGKRMEKGEYKYYIKEIETGKKYELKETKKEGEYTYTGLTHNKEYQIKVEARNENGTVEKESSIIRTVTLEELEEAEINYKYNPTGWTNDSITITAEITKEIPEGYRIETSKDATNWEEKTSQNFITNGEMYVRITDGTNETTYAVGQVTKIDKQKPVVTGAEAGITNVAITATDEASGITGYAVVSTNTEPSTYTTCTNTKSLSTTVTGLVANTTYYVFVKDEAGNVSISKQFTTQNNTPPTVVAKNTDTSNVTRKTDIKVTDLFTITWGSAGEGTVTYNVTGNLEFNNTAYNKSISNISELEIGRYTVTCTVKSPANETATTDKQVNVLTLAGTTVTNTSNAEVPAYAIYSEYDLAYFRDLVNKGQSNLNGKLMNDINLSNVCSQTVGSWIPIGHIKSTDITFYTLQESVVFTATYSGIFDGNLKSISNLWVNNTSASDSKALFGAVKDGIIKNCIVNNVNVKANKVVAAIVAYSDTSIIQNCKASGNIEGNYFTGGIAGYIRHNSTIYASKNEANIIAGGGDQFGGVVAMAKGSDVKYCYNTGSISGSSTGGIAGIIGRLGNTNISYCYNNGTINANAYAIGGIAGRILYEDEKNTPYRIDNCYNLANLTGVKNTTDNIGGIAGSIEGNSRAIVYLKNIYNKGSVSNGKVIGGISGYQAYATFEGESLNYGSVLNHLTSIGAMSGNNYGNVIFNTTKREYGGNCSSKLNTNGNGTNKLYNASLEMPTVYSIVNATNTNEFTTTGASLDAPKLKNIE